MRASMSGSSPPTTGTLGGRAVGGRMSCAAAAAFHSTPNSCAISLSVCSFSSGSGAPIAKHLWR